MPQLHYTRQDIQEQYLGTKQQQSQQQKLQSKGQSRGTIESQSASTRGSVSSGGRRARSSDPKNMEPEENSGSYDSECENEDSSDAGGSRGRRAQRSSSRKRRRRAHSAALFSGCFTIPNIGAMLSGGGSSHQNQQSGSGQESGQRRSFLSHLGLGGQQTGRRQQQQQRPISSSQTLNNLQLSASGGQTTQKINPFPNSPSTGQLSAGGNRKHVSFGGQRPLQVKGAGDATAISNSSNSQVNAAENNPQLAPQLSPLSNQTATTNSNINSTTEQQGSSNYVIGNQPLNNAQQQRLNNATVDNDRQSFPSPIYLLGQQVIGSTASGAIQIEHSGGQPVYLPPKRHNPTHSTSASPQAIYHNYTSPHHHHHPPTSGCHPMARGQQAQQPPLARMAPPLAPAHLLQQTTVYRKLPAVPMRTQATQTEITAYHLMATPPSVSSSSSMAGGLGNQANRAPCNMPPSAQHRGAAHQCAAHHGSQQQPARPTGSGRSGDEQYQRPVELQPAPGCRAEPAYLPPATEIEPTPKPQAKRMVKGGPAAKTQRHATSGQLCAGEDGSDEWSADEEDDEAGDAELECGNLNASTLVSGSSSSSSSSLVGHDSALAERLAETNKRLGDLQSPSSCRAPQEVIEGGAHRRQSVAATTKNEESNEALAAGRRKSSGCATWKIEGETMGKGAEEAIEPPSEFKDEGERESSMAPETSQLLSLGEDDDSLAAPQEVAPICGTRLRADSPPSLSEASSQTEGSFCDVVVAQKSHRESRPAATRPIAISGQRTARGRAQASRSSPSSSSSSVTPTGGNESDEFSSRRPVAASLGEQVIATSGQRDSKPQEKISDLSCGQPTTEALGLATSGDQITVMGCGDNNDDKRVGCATTDSEKPNDDDDALRSGDLLLLSEEQPQMNNGQSEEELAVGCRLPVAGASTPAEQRRDDFLQLRSCTESGSQESPIVANVSSSSQSSGGQSGSQSGSQRAGLRLSKRTPLASTTLSARHHSYCSNEDFINDSAALVCAEEPTARGTDKDDERRKLAAENDDAEADNYNEGRSEGDRNELRAAEAASYVTHLCADDDEETETEPRASASTGQQLKPAVGASANDSRDEEMDECSSDSPEQRVGSKEDDCAELEHEPEQEVAAAQREEMGRGAIDGDGREEASPLASCADSVATQVGGRKEKVANNNNNGADKNSDSCILSPAPSAERHERVDEQRSSKVIARGESRAEEWSSQSSSSSANSSGSVRRPLLRPENGTGETVKHEPPPLAHEDSDRRKSSGSPPTTVSELDEDLSTPSFVDSYRQRVAQVCELADRVLDETLGECLADGGAMIREEPEGRGQEPEVSSSSTASSSSSTTSTTSLSGARPYVCCHPKREAHRPPPSRPKLPEKPAHLRGTSSQAAAEEQRSTQSEEEAAAALVVVATSVAGGAAAAAMRSIAEAAATKEQTSPLDQSAESGAQVAVETSSGQAKRREPELDPTLGKLEQEEAGEKKQEVDGKQQLDSLHSLVVREEEAGAGSGSDSERQPFEEASPGQELAGQEAAIATGSGRDNEKASNKVTGEQEAARAGEATGSSDEPSSMGTEILACRTKSALIHQQSSSSFDCPALVSRSGSICSAVSVIPGNSRAEVATEQQLGGSSELASSSSLAAEAQAAARQLLADFSRGDSTELADDEREEEEAAALTELPSSRSAASSSRSDSPSTAASDSRRATLATESSRSAASTRSSDSSSSSAASLELQQLPPSPQQPPAGARLGEGKLLAAGGTCGRPSQAEAVSQKVSLSPQGELSTVSEVSEELSGLQVPAEELEGQQHQRTRASGGSSGEVKPPPEVAAAAQQLELMANIQAADLTQMGELATDQDLAHSEYTLRSQGSDVANLNLLSTSNSGAAPKNLQDQMLGQGAGKELAQLRRRSSASSAGGRLHSAGQSSGAGGVAKVPGVDCPYVPDIIPLSPPPSALQQQTAAVSGVVQAPAMHLHRRLSHDDTMEAIEDDVEGEEQEMLLQQQQQLQQQEVADQCPMPPPPPPMDIEPPPAFTGSPELDGEMDEQVCSSPLKQEEDDEDEVSDNEEEEESSISVSQHGVVVTQEVGPPKGAANSSKARKSPQSSGSSLSPVISPEKQQITPTKSSFQKPEVDESIDQQREQSGHKSPELSSSKQLKSTISTESATDAILEHLSRHHPEMPLDEPSPALEPSSSIQKSSLSEHKREVWRREATSSSHSVPEVEEESNESPGPTESYPTGTMKRRVKPEASPLANKSADDQSNGGESPALTPASAGSGQRRGPPLGQTKLISGGDARGVSSGGNGGNQQPTGSLPTDASICSSCSCLEASFELQDEQQQQRKLVEQQKSVQQPEPERKPQEQAPVAAALNPEGPRSAWMSQEEGTVFTENYWLSHWLYISEHEESEIWRQAIDMSAPVASTSTEQADSSTVEKSEEREAATGEQQQQQRQQVAGMPRNMTEVSSTGSERSFSAKYKSTTRKMIHRRATIEMYNRIMSNNLKREKRVEISRSNGEFGFRIHGSRPVVVSAIERGTSAETCGLQVGDLIYAINGTNILDMAHSDVVKLAHSADSSALVLDLVPTNDFLRLSKYNRASNKRYEPTVTGFLMRLSPSTAQPLLVELQDQMSRTPGASSQQRAAKLNEVMRLAWRKRYFVLRSDNCLYWYKSATEIEPSGGVNLQGFSASLTNEFSEPNYVIRLVKYGSQPHYLGTNNICDIQTWIDAINKAATEANQNDPYMKRTLTLARLKPSLIPEPDCAGYLYKFSHKSHKSGAHWRAAYFVLKDACLYLFRDQQSETVNQASAVYYLQGYRVRNKHIEHKKHTFELIPPNRKTIRPMFLMASSEIDRKRWIAALEYSIDRWIEID